MGRTADPAGGWVAKSDTLVCLILHKNDSRVEEFNIF